MLMVRSVGFKADCLAVPVIVLVLFSPFGSNVVLVMVALLVIVVGSAIVSLMRTCTK